VKILIADKFSTEHLEQLERSGHEVSFEPDLTKTDLIEAIAGYEALVVRSTRVTPELIAVADKLGVIVRAGAGVNTIAVAEAARRGIFVCNTPGKNAIAVAELTMGLILAIDRNIPDQVEDLRNGRWRKKKYARAKGLAGRSIGIVGLGSIGLEVAKRSAAFAMEVAVLDRPGRDPDRLKVLQVMGARFEPDLVSLAGSCDIISFHVPATADTENLLSREVLDAVRPETVIINTSRGSVIDEEALLSAIDEKNLRVGLDVYKGEPGSGEAEFVSSLAQHENVYGTHHIGASTSQAQAAIADAVIETIEAFHRGVLMNCVNVSRAAGPELTITVRHYNRVGVLAEVLNALRQAGLNVENMENLILEGRTAASAIIKVVGEIDESTTTQLGKLDNVIAVSVSGR
jgi:D-3-phosphoglycerate dehydrogenase